MVAALLLLKNHGIKMVGVTTENSFVNTMHRFFEKYVFKEGIFQAMKDWVSFRDKEEEFHTTAIC